MLDTWYDHPDPLCQSTCSSKEGPSDGRSPSNIEKHPIPLKQTSKALKSKLLKTIRNLSFPKSIVFFVWPMEITNSNSCLCFEQWPCRVGDGIQQPAVVHGPLAPNLPDRLFELRQANPPAPAATDLTTRQQRRNDGRVRQLHPKSLGKDQICIRRTEPDVIT